MSKLIQWDRRDDRGAHLVDLIFQQGVVPKKSGTRFLTATGPDIANTFFLCFGANADQPGPYPTVWQSLIDDADTQYLGGIGQAPFAQNYSARVRTTPENPSSAKYYVEYKARYSDNGLGGVLGTAPTINFGFQPNGSGLLYTSGDLSVVSGPYALTQAWQTFTTPQLGAPAGTPPLATFLEVDAFTDTDTDATICIGWARVKVVP